MPWTEPRSTAESQHYVARPEPHYETYLFHPNPERDLNEMNRWLDSIPGRIISVLAAPWDPTCLLAVTLRYL